jgi:cell division protein FtsQ
VDSGYERAAPREHGPAFRSGRSPARRPLQGEVLLDDATKRRLRRIRIRRAVALATLIGVIAVTIALYASPVFRVRNVEVAGATTLDPQTVANLVEVNGQSMLFVDFTEARTAIEELPQVSSVTFERKFPGTVRVTVTERAPWGLWIVGAETYVIDAEGVVLPAAPVEGLPAIATNSNAVLKPGDRVDADAVRLTQALAARVPQEIALNLVAIEWSQDRGLTVATDAGYRVVIGDSENMDYKLLVWKTIEADLGREAMNGHVLDLRFGDRPSFQ